MFSQETRDSDQYTANTERTFTDCSLQTPTRADAENQRNFWSKSCRFALILYNVREPLFLVADVKSVYWPLVWTLFLEVGNNPLYWPLMWTILLVKVVEDIMKAKVITSNAHPHQQYYFNSLPVSYFPQLSLFSRGIISQWYKNSRSAVNDAIVCMITNLNKYMILNECMHAFE